MDCTFKTGQGRFNYRVGAIIIHENNILMVKNSRDSYYYMKPIEDYNLISESLTEDGIEESLEWIPLKDIENYKVYPTFFKDKKLMSNQDIIHIVYREH